MKCFHHVASWSAICMLHEHIPRYHHLLTRNRPIDSTTKAPSTKDWSSIRCTGLSAIVRKLKGRDCRANLKDSERNWWQASSAERRQCVGHLPKPETSILRRFAAKTSWKLWPPAMKPVYVNSLAIWSTSPHSHIICGYCHCDCHYIRRINQRASRVFHVHCLFWAMLSPASHHYSNLFIVRLLKQAPHSRLHPEGWVSVDRDT